MRNNYFALASYHIKDFGVQGLSHIALPEKRLHELLKDKLNIPGVNGIFYIQTCNRIEYLYSLSGSVKLEEQFNLLFPHITKRFYSEERDVINHLLSVCLSKDSMVFGENQILGQFREAFLSANDSGLLNRDLHQILRFTLQEAKRIRSETNFRHFPSSMSTLAAKRIQQLVSADASVLFVGAGETNELVARHLLKKNFRNFSWLNRTESKAVAVAQSTAGSAVSWEQVLQFKNTYDVVVTATTAGEILFTQQHLDALQTKVAIDLSMPANIEVNNTSNLEFFNVENFKVDLASVEHESAVFLELLNQKIEDSIAEIQQNLRLDRLSPLLADYHQTQQQIMERHKASLEKALSGSTDKDKVLAWFDKTFKELSHHNFIELKKAINHVSP